MKLLIFMQSFPVLGGTQIWIEYLTNKLYKFGWEITLILTSGDFCQVDEFVNYYDIKDFIKLTNKSGTANGRVLAVSDIIEEENPDIVAYVYVAAVPDAVRYLRMNGKFDGKLVLPLHVDFSGLFNELANNLDIIDAVITPNRYMIEKINRLSSIENSRIFYANCGVEVEQESSKNKLGKQLRLGYAGRMIEEQKNVSVIPRIVSELLKRDFEINICLAGNGPSLPGLTNELVELAGDNNVRILGRIQPKQMHEKFYSSIDVLLITSDWETGPLIAWEAMSAGVLVLTSEFTGLIEEGALKNEYNCITYPVGDATCAAKRLDQLVGSGAITDILSNAKKTIENKYSIEASLRAWDTAFRSALALPQLTMKRSFAFKMHGRLDKVIGPFWANRTRSLLSNVGFYPKDKNIQSANEEWPNYQK